MCISIFACLVAGHIPLSRGTLLPLTLLRVLPCLRSAPALPSAAANTLKVIPNNAIRWMVFEHLKQSAYFKRLFVSFNVPEKSPDTQPAPKGRLN